MALNLDQKASVLSIWYYLPKFQNDGLGYSQLVRMDIVVYCENNNIK